ncbi:S8 family serine peptidase [Paenibacillus sp. SGZ-1009]|uniref:S8 family serine peptidase n=1 Tax=Paenibacillus campi TaxID=3106031 RepID=UPI002AFE9097|nr:S8 family serine peptidase [Paenibacillus sp. SGZ-1009]
MNTKTNTKRKQLLTWSIVTMLTVSIGTGPSTAAAAAQGTAQSPYIINQADTAGSISGSLHEQEHMISPDIDTSSSNPVSVIVQMTDQPAAVQVNDDNEQAEPHDLLSDEKLATSQHTVSSQQNDVLQQASNDNISYKVNYRYNTVLNGFEMTLPANQIPELAKLPGIKSIYKNKKYTILPVPDNQDTATKATYDAVPLSLIGVQTAWAKGLTGKGVKVGVLDTGIDYDHPDLKGAYKGGYDSVDHDRDPYETPPVSAADDVYGTGYAGSWHGTHVSGTIAGRAANTQSDVVQKGVAYGADLYMYRVMHRDPQTNSDTGDTATIIDGIEHAVKDGMEVINMSIGTDDDKDINAPETIAVNNAVLSGVTVVIANGNAATPDSYYYSMGEPATSQLAIAVGASTVPVTHYSATVRADVYSADVPTDRVTANTYGPSNTAVANTNNQNSNSVNRAYDLNMLAWETAHDQFASVLGTNPLQGVYVGLGADADYNGKNVTGKVVLASRGGLTFVQKVKNAKQHGALALILFNGNSDANDPNKADLSDSISGRDGYIGYGAFLDDSFDYIPTFDMKGAEGRALARAALAHTDQPIQFTFGANYPQQDVSGDHIASFSSRGPNQDGELGIKPDLVAPGMYIRSTMPEYGKYIKNASYADAYARENGTSMATPHVTGMAALLKQEHPDWTPFDIRAALANTSVPLVDESGQPYDVYSQGAGRADIGAAVNTPAVLETVDNITILDKKLNSKAVTNYNPSASFGVMQADGKPHDQTLQLKNTSGTAVTYHASVHMHPSVTSDPLSPVPTPNVNNIQAVLQGIGADGTITANPNEATSFTLSVTPSAAAADGVYEGDVQLTADGYPSLHLPFVLHIGQDQPDTGLGIQQVQINHPVVRLNGKEDAADLSFRLMSTNINALELDVFDINGDYVGTLVQEIKTSPDTFAPGYYDLSGLDNIVTYLGDDGSSQVQILQPGTYQLRLNAYHLDENGNVVQSATKIANSIYRIAGTEQDRVKAAAAAFHKVITGNQTIGQPVITLPQSNRLNYQILSSSDTNYVDNTGKLLKLPTSSHRIVRLQIKISSINDPSASTTVTAQIKIQRQQ